MSITAIGNEVAGEEFAAGPGRTALPLFGLAEYAAVVGAGGDAAAGAAGKTARKGFQGAEHVGIVTAVLEYHLVGLAADASQTELAT